MKPVIIVTGTPHSYTSMISKFLIDNGAYAKETWDNPKFNMKYSRYEDKDIQDFVNQRKKFKKYNLTDYFKSFPDNQVCITKMPLSIYFVNELDKFTTRPIKVIYVMRNPEQIILSSMEKGGKSFIYYFQRMSRLYDFMVNCKFDLLPFVSERIKSDNKRILEFCKLSPNKIDLSSIKKLHHRKPTYLKFRFANFFWKRLSRFFRLF